MKPNSITKMISAHEFYDGLDPAFIPVPDDNQGFTITRPQLMKHFGSMADPRVDPGFFASYLFGIIADMVEGMRPDDGIPIHERQENGLEVAIWHGIATGNYFLRVVAGGKYHEVALPRCADPGRPVPGHIFWSGDGSVKIFL